MDSELIEESRALRVTPGQKEELAQMLSGYEDETWRRLREDRRRTYQRAAHILLCDFVTIAGKIGDWTEKHDEEIEEA